MTSVPTNTIVILACHPRPVSRKTATSLENLNNYAPKEAFLDPRLLHAQEKKKKKNPPPPEITRAPTEIELVPWAIRD